MKIKKYQVDEKGFDIVLKKGKYYLNIKSEYSTTNKLMAPIEEKMKRDIYESIDEVVNVTLKKDNQLIFSGDSKSCGLEIVLSKE